MVAATTERGRFLNSRHKNMCTQLCGAVLDIIVNKGQAPVHPESLSKGGSASGSPFDRLRANGLGGITEIIRDNVYLVDGYSLAVGLFRLDRGSGEHVHDLFGHFGKLCE